MSKDIKKDLPDFVEVEVKNESSLFEMFLPETENEHPVCDSMNSVAEGYSSVTVKKEFEHIDIDEPNTEEVKVESSYDNFQCKEEVHDEELSEILIKLETQNQQNVEEFSENNEADEKIDISEIIMQSRIYEDKRFKVERENDNENQRAFTQRKSPDDDPLKQGKEKIHCSTINSNSNAKIKNCQFCNKSFSRKWSLDDHIVRQHKQEIKGDWKSFITSKVYTCSICNTYHTTKKVNIDRHIHLVHKEAKTEMKCQFCTDSFITQTLLDEHILKNHRDEIKNDIKSFITNKIHMCIICNSFETTRKWSLDQHINLVHNEVKNKVKCQFCTEVFISKKTLDGHVLRKHNEEIKNDIKNFITTKIYKCEICNSYETTHKTSLDQHINSFHNKVKIKCQFCAERLIHKQSLDEHVLRKHKDKIKDDIRSFITNKIHVCKICNSFQTTHTSHLVRHINSIHNKVKIKMKCQFCTQSFIDKRSLDGHVLRKHKDKIENDIKNFITNKIHICKICNSFETTLKSNLNQHMKSVHNEEKIKKKCQFCTELFAKQMSLDGHLLRKHKAKIKGDMKGFITSKIYSCKTCPFKTVNKSGLDKHVNSAHNKS